MSLNKITCGVSTTSDLISSVNGLIDVSKINTGNDKLIVVGDSNSVGVTLATPTGVIATVASGVCTLTVPNHQMNSGWKFRLAKTTSTALNALNNGFHTVSSYTGTNTFTFLAAGVPDGTYTGGEFINLQKVPATHFINVQSLLGGGYNLARNEAISGDGVNDILARLSSITSISDANRVHLMIGTNDVLRGTAFSTITANFIQVINGLIDSGKVLTVSTIPPISGDSARSKVVIDLNNWITRYCESRAVTVVDAYSILVNTATNNFKTGYSDDGIHLNALGHLKLGEYLASAIKVKAAKPILANTKSTLQVIDNSLFLTSGGSLASGFTGAVAAGFFTLRTGAASIVASLVSKGDYNAQKFDATASAGERVIFYTGELIADLPIGTKVRMKACISSANWSLVRNVSMLAYVTNSGVIGQASAGYNSLSGTTPYSSLDNNRELFIQSQEFEITPNSTSVVVRFDVTLNGSVAIEISKVVLEVSV